MERKVEEKGIPLQIHLAMLLVVLFWGIQVGAKGFAISKANPVYNLISLALVPVAMAKIVFNRYDPKVIIRCVLLFRTAAGIMLTTGDTRALIIALSVLAFKDVSMEKIMGMTFVVRGISFAMRIMLCLAGVLDKEVNDLGECGFRIRPFKPCTRRIFLYICRFFTLETEKCKSLSAWSAESCQYSAFRLYPKQNAVHTCYRYVNDGAYDRSGMVQTFSAYMCPEYIRGAFSRDHCTVAALLQDAASDTRNLFLTFSDSILYVQDIQT